MKLEKVEGITLTPHRIAIYKEYGIASDFHFGLEDAAFLSISVELELFSSLWEEIVSHYSFSTLIMNGDVKHNFDYMKFTIERKIVNALELIMKTKKVILIKGNHDNYLIKIAKDLGIEIAEEYVIDNVIVTHGHLEAKEKDKIYIIGNEHPVIGLRDRLGFYEKIPVYLFVKRPRRVLVLPAFSPLTKGSDILQQETFLSPVLSNINSNNIEIYPIVGDSVEYLGKLSDFVRV